MINDFECLISGKAGCRLLVQFNQNFKNLLRNSYGISIGTNFTNLTSPLEFKMISTLDSADVAIRCYFLFVQLATHHHSITGITSIDYFFIFLTVFRLLVLHLLILLLFNFPAIRSPLLFCLPSPLNFIHFIH